MTENLRHATVVIVVEVIGVVSLCGGGREHQLDTVSVILHDAVIVPGDVASVTNPFLQRREILRGLKLAIVFPPLIFAGRFALFVSENCGFPRLQQQSSVIAAVVSAGRHPALIRAGEDREQCAIQVMKQSRPSSSLYRELPARLRQTYFPLREQGSCPLEPTRHRGRFQARLQSSADAFARR